MDALRSVYHGTYLVADPIKSFDDLGFTHGRHYIKAEPAELADVLAKCDGRDEAEQIAWQG
jgi:hypothetical protein